MTRADMDRVRDQFVAAAEMAARAGFDMLEIHCAHGYLLSSFITPLTNRRTDEYGGSLENRMRYPLEIFHAVRAVWPAEKPISVRISANDWVGADGIEPHDAVAISRLLQEAGVDICDVSAGQTSIKAQPVYGRMFQTPFSDRIRNETGMATMAVGNIFEPDHVNSILMAGRADLVCLARPHLADPYWTLHAAAKLGDRGETWPQPYLRRPRSALSALRRRRASDDNGGVMIDLAGKHALVTGGGSGIGAAIALALAEAGATRHHLRAPPRAAGSDGRAAQQHSPSKPPTSPTQDSIAQLYAARANGARDIRHRRRQCRRRAKARRPRKSRASFGSSTLARQSHRRVPFGAAGARRHARAQLGPHHLHRLDRRA